jgi:hypothetical protein
MKVAPESWNFGIKLSESLVNNPLKVNRVVGSEPQKHPTLQ